MDKGNYKYLGENFPYTGEVIWLKTEEVVGEWLKGNIIKDPIETIIKEENRLYKDMDIKTYSIDLSKMPTLVQTILDKVLMPIPGEISAKINRRYSSYFLNGKRFLHFYDRSPSRIQLHVEKKYLENNGLNFNQANLNTFFLVKETQEDFVIKIADDKELERLSRFFLELYG